MSCRQVCVGDVLRHMSANGSRFEVCDELGNVDWLMACGERVRQSAALANSDGPWFHEDGMVALHRKPILPKRSDTFWDRKQALETCSMLDLLLRPHGYTVGLAGSVVYRGFSHKDLDLIVFPLGPIYGVHDISEVYDVLAWLGWKCEHDRDGVREQWRVVTPAELPVDTKHVEIWRDQRSRRVDLFFLR